MTGYRFLPETENIDFFKNSKFLGFYSLELVKKKKRNLPCFATHVREQTSFKMVFNDIV